MLLFGCSGPDDEQPSGQGGTSGRSQGGAQSVAGAGMPAAGSAGTAGSSSAAGGSLASGGAGEPGCSQRWLEYDALAKAARVCDPNAAAPQCKFNVVVLDSCGCSVPANGSSPEYAQARQRLTSYAEDCEFPEQCVGCPSTLDAACKATGTGVSECVYQ
jgi:hypothetical protein